MIVDDNGTIKMYQGDSGEITLSGFNPEHDYMVYLQFLDEDGNFVGGQIETRTNFADTVTIPIVSAVSDELTVDAGEDYKLYYLGGKKAEISVINQDLYGWINGSTIIYTHSDTPAVNDKIYDEDNEETEYTISAIETEEEEVTEITVSATDYTRDTDADTQVTVSEQLITEDTIIPELGGKKPVIVYRKVAEGPA